MKELAWMDRIVRTVDPVYVGGRFMIRYSIGIILFCDDFPSEFLLHVFLSFIIVPISRMN